MNADKIKSAIKSFEQTFFHRGSDYSVVHEKMHTELEIVASRGDGNVINCHGEVLPHFS